MAYLRLKLLLISFHCEPLTVRHWLFAVFCLTFVLQMLVRVEIDLLDDDNKCDVIFATFKAFHASLKNLSINMFSILAVWH